MRLEPCVAPLELLFLRQDQWRPAEWIEAAQWKRFKHVLEHAYARSPFYRRRFQEAGLLPRDIRDRRDLTAIPITRREDLARSEELLVRGAVPARLHRSFTSGSTWRRTTTYFDRRAWLEARLLVKMRARLACGIGPKDRIAIFTTETVRSGRLRSMVLRQRRFSAFEAFADQLPALERYDPTALYGFPSLLLEMAGRSGRLAPTRIFTSSEVLDPVSRNRLERAFGAEVFDVYGSTEVKEIAWECPRHEGYHINADWLLVEFLKDGRPTSEDDASIVVTTLYNAAMPLIRYEIGDTGRRLDQTCSCGRGLPLMTPTRGRLVDYLTLPDGSRRSPYAVTCAVESIGGMRQYQVRQGQHDRVTVRVVPDAAYGMNTARRIAERLREVLPGVRIDVTPVQSIERERSGKFRIVSSAVHPARRNAP